MKEPGGRTDPDHCPRFPAVPGSGLRIRDSLARLSGKPPSRNHLKRRIRGIRPDQRRSAAGQPIHRRGSLPAFPSGKIHIHGSKHGKRPDRGIPLQCRKKPLVQTACGSPAGKKQQIGTARHDGGVTVRIRHQGVVTGGEPERDADRHDDCQEHETETQRRTAQTQKRQIKRGSHSAISNIR